MPEKKPTPTEHTHQAGLFDVRTVIGGLLAIYGVILLITGIVSSQRSDGINANLWSGLVMLVVGVLFLLWARLKPVVVPDTVDKDDFLQQ